MYSKAVKEATIAFVSKYGDAMVAAIKDTGIFFPTIVAQKALESGWGKSELTEKYNNFGGVKNFGKLPNAGVVNMPTREYENGKQVTRTQPFATYATPLVAFQSYIWVLQDPTKKYVAKGVFSAKSPEEQIKAMAEAGYTTTPPADYLKRMQSIVDAARDLYKYGKVDSNSTNTSASSVLSASASAYGMQSSINSLRTAFKNFIQ